MPSLIGSNLGGVGESGTIAQNYLTSYGTFQSTAPFTNFGTRVLRFVKVTAVAADGSTAVNFSTNYQQSNSSFSKAVRSLQVVGELYGVFAPNSAGFVAVFSDDTLNDSNTNSNVEDASYGDVEAAIVSALALGGSSACTVATISNLAVGATI